MNWGISILDEAIDMPRTSSDPLAGMLMGLGQSGEKEKKEKEKGKKEKDKKSKGKLFAAVNIFSFFLKLFGSLNSLSLGPGVRSLFILWCSIPYLECNDPNSQLLAILRWAGSTAKPWPGKKHKKDKEKKKKHKKEKEAQWPLPFEHFAGHC